MSFSFPEIHKLAIFHLILLCTMASTANDVTNNFRHNKNTNKNNDFNFHGEHINNRKIINNRIQVSHFFIYSDKLR